MLDMERLPNENLRRMTIFASPFCSALDFNCQFLGDIRCHIPKLTYAKKCRVLDGIKCPDQARVFLDNCCERFLIEGISFCGISGRRARAKAIEFSSTRRSTSSLRRRSSSRSLLSSAPSLFLSIRAARRCCFWRESRFIHKMNVRSSLAVCSNKCAANLRCCRAESLSTAAIASFKAGVD